MAAGQIISVAYGIEIQDRNDPYVVDAEIAVEAFAATANPGSYMVDLLPIRKSLPSCNL